VLLHEPWRRRDRSRSGKVSLNFASNSAGFLISQRGGHGQAGIPSGAAQETLADGTVSPPRLSPPEPVRVAWPSLARPVIDGLPTSASKGVLTSSALRPRLAHLEYIANAENATTMPRTVKPFGEFLYPTLADRHAVGTEVVDAVALARSRKGTG